MSSGAPVGRLPDFPSSLERAASFREDSYKPGSIAKQLGSPGGYYGAAGGDRGGGGAVWSNGYLTAGAGDDAGSPTITAAYPGSIRSTSVPRPSSYRATSTTPAAAVSSTSYRSGGSMTSGHTSTTGRAGGIGSIAAGGYGTTGGGGGGAGASSILDSLRGGGAAGGRSSPMAILAGVSTRTAGSVTHTRAGSVTAGHTQGVLQPPPAARKTSLDVPSSSTAAAAAYVGGYSTSYGSGAGGVGYGSTAAGGAVAEYLQHGRLPATGESFRLPLSSTAIVGAGTVGGAGRGSSIMANRGGSYHSSHTSHTSHTSTGATTLNSYQLRMASGSATSSQQQQSFGSATMPVGSYGGYAGQQYEGPTTAQVYTTAGHGFHSQPPSSQPPTAPSPARPLVRQSLQQQHQASSQPTSPSVATSSLYTSSPSHTSSPVSPAAVLSNQQPHHSQQYSQQGGAVQQPPQQQYHAPAPPAEAGITSSSTLHQHSPRQLSPRQYSGSQQQAVQQQYMHTNGVALQGSGHTSQSQSHFLSQQGAGQQGLGPYERIASPSASMIRTAIEGTGPGSGGRTSAIQGYGTAGAAGIASLSRQSSHALGNTQGGPVSPSCALTSSSNPPSFSGGSSSVTSGSLQQTSSLGSAVQYPTSAGSGTSSTGGPLAVHQSTTTTTTTSQQPYPSSQPSHLGHGHTSQAHTSQVTHPHPSHHLQVSTASTSYQPASAGNSQPGTPTYAVPPTSHQLQTNHQSYPAQQSAAAAARAHQTGRASNASSASTSSSNGATAGGSRRGSDSGGSGSSSTHPGYSGTRGAGGTRMASHSSHSHSHSHQQQPTSPHSHALARQSQSQSQSQLASMSSYSTSSDRLSPTSPAAAAGGSAAMQPGSPVILRRIQSLSMRSCGIRDQGPGTGCVGLQNLGNTCFMNSILQVLNAVPELVTWCHSEAEWKAKAVVAPAYVDLVNAMWKASPQSVVSPSKFVKSVSRHDSRWGDGSQQDSQEFLHSLLEALQSESNRITAKPVYKELPGKGSEEQQAEEAEEYARTWHDSIVDDIFGGLMQSTLTCTVCRRESHCFEPFMDLMLPIPEVATKRQAVSVQDCLQSFVDLERLEGSDSPKCEACKKCVPHTKRLQIWRPPRLLILCLKRFAQRSTSGGLFSRFRSTAKNNTAVSLEVDALELAPYCNPAGLRQQALQLRPGGTVSPVYQLVAVSHHTGSLEGGHYTATARSASDSQWYNFNDSHVRRDAKPGGASSSAYVLVYRLESL